MYKWVALGLVKEVIDINQLNLEDVEDGVKVEAKVWNQMLRVLEELEDAEEKDEQEEEENVDN